MPDIWKFSPVGDETDTYADGTTVPGRRQRVFLNDEAVGEIEIHMHRRRGRDGATDISFGVTAVAYGVREDGGTRS